MCAGKCSLAMRRIGRGGVSRLLVIACASVSGASALATSGRRFRILPPATAQFEDRMPPLPCGERVEIGSPGWGKHNGVGTGGTLWPASATLARFLANEVCRIRSTQGWP